MKNPFFLSCSNNYTVYYLIFEATNIRYFLFSKNIFIFFQEMLSSKSPTRIHNEPNNRTNVLISRGFNLSDNVCSIIVFDDVSARFCMCCSQHVSTDTSGFRSVKDGVYTLKKTVSSINGKLYFTPDDESRYFDLCISPVIQPMFKVTFTPYASISYSYTLKRYIFNGNKMDSLLSICTDIVNVQIQSWIPVHQGG